MYLSATALITLVPLGLAATGPGLSSDQCHEQKEDRARSMSLVSYLKSKLERERESRVDLEDMLDG